MSDFDDDSEQLLCLHNDPIKFHPGAKSCFHSDPQRLDREALTKLREQIIKTPAPKRSKIGEICEDIKLCGIKRYLCAYGLLILRKLRIISEARFMYFMWKL